MQTGTAIRNAIMWNDERSAAQVAALERNFGPELHRLTGKPPSMTASISKLLWLAEHEPELVARTARFLDVHAFLVHRLTGQYRTGLANADPLGVLDMERRTWADDLIRAIGLRPDQFVELVEPGAADRLRYSRCGGCHRSAGRPARHRRGRRRPLCRTGRPTSRGEGIAYLNLGTGIASGACSPTYLCDRAFRTLIAPVPGSYYVEHILRGGVYTVAWFVERFAADLRGGEQGRSAEAILEEAAAQIAPGAEGLSACALLETT